MSASSTTATSPSYLSSELYKKWFPAKNSCSHFPLPSLRVICLAGAGMEQLVYLSKGSSRNPMPNPLLEFAAANNVQVLSAQLPGRSARHREEGLPSAQAVAQHLFMVLKPLLLPLEEVHNGKWEGGPIEGEEGGGEIGVLNSKQSCVPYILLGHSMGCFCLYEFVRLLEQQLVKTKDTSENNKHNICSSSNGTTVTSSSSNGTTVTSSSRVVPSDRVSRLPLMLLLTCCLSPDYPEDKRPWNKSYGMTDNQLKEEAKLWDVNSEVFKDDIWSVYSKLFRTDFPIFDSYVMTPKSTTTTAVSGTESLVATNKIICWYAEFDKRIKREMVEGWGQLLLCDKLQEGGGATGKDLVVGTPAVGRFEVRELSGATHGFLYDSRLRESWMKEVVDIISKQIANCWATGCCG
eukprot:GHVS01026837.1.p1 GENE.GHVS01026837.1~~GHVS01026837.1.p1  ORF type:complete len:406 (+),score=98.66 GHVS01026837.1:56-1273(+)